MIRLFITSAMLVSSFSAHSSEASNPSELGIIAAASSANARYRLEQSSQDLDGTNCILQLRRDDFASGGEQTLSIKDPELACMVAGSVSLELEERYEGAEWGMIKLRRGSGCETSDERVVLFQADTQQFALKSEFAFANVQITRRDGLWQSVHGVLPLQLGFYQSCTGELASDCPGLPASLSLASGVLSPQVLSVGERAKVESSIAQMWQGVVEIGELSATDATSEVRRLKGELDQQVARQLWSSDETAALDEF